MRDVKTTTLALLYCFVAAASLPHAPLDPNEPREGDPDLTLVKDARLVDLYRATVIALRTIEEGAYKAFYDATRHGPDTVEAKVAARKELGSTLKNMEAQVPPLPDEDVAYALAAAEQGVAPPGIRWAEVRTALWALTKVNAPGDEAIHDRLVGICRAILEAPRGEKLPDEQGYAYMDAIAILSTIHTGESLEILHRSSTEAFWENPVPYSRVLSRFPHSCQQRLAYLSVRAIGEFPSHMSLPVLTELKVQFPLTEPPRLTIPEEENTIKNRAPTTIAGAIHTVHLREGLAMPEYLVERYGDADDIEEETQRRMAETIRYLEEMARQDPNGEAAVELQLLKEQLADENK